MKKQINGSAQTTIVALNEEYSLTISNTSHVFEADSNGAAKSSSTTIDLKGYLGQKKVKTTFVSVTGTKTGMKVTSQQLDYNTVRIQVSVDNKLTSAVGNSGELEITVSLDGIPTNQMKKIFSWSKAIAGKPGQNGSNGTNGKDGRSVTSIVEMYYKSTSATSLAGGNWSTTYPGWENGKYIWTKSVINYSSGNPDETKPVCVTGSKGTDGKNGTNGTNGAPGKDGQNGTDGISVTKVDVWYYLSTSATQLTGGTWSTNAPAWTQGKYMWSKTVTTYSKGNPTESKPVCISGSKGDKGKDGANGVNGKDGQNGAPGKDGQNGAPGKDGANGQPGKDGKGIKSTTTTYQIWNNGTSVPTGSWSTTPPKTTAEKPYLWTKIEITYTDNSKALPSYSVGSTIEGVQVGGRNLVPNNSSYWVQGNWSIPAVGGDCVIGAYDHRISLKNSLVIVPNEIYWVKIYSTKNVSVLFRLLDKEGHFLRSEIGLKNRKWIAPSDCYFINLTIYEDSVLEDIQTGITRIKLEKGNMATDWTPAPEDVDSQINNKASQEDLYQAVQEAQESLSAEIDKTIEAQIGKTKTDIMNDLGGQIEIGNQAVKREIDANGKQIRDLEYFASKMNLKGNEFTVGFQKTKGVNLIKNSVMKQHKTRGGSGTDASDIKANFWINSSLKEDYLPCIAYGEDAISRAHTDSGSFFRGRVYESEKITLDYIFSDVVDHKKKADNILLAYKLREATEFNAGKLFIGLVFYKRDNSATGMGTVTKDGGIQNAYYVPTMEYTGANINGVFDQDSLFKSMPITRSEVKTIEQTLEVQKVYAQPTADTTSPDPNLIEQYVVLPYQPIADSTVMIESFGPEGSQVAARVEGHKVYLPIDIVRDVATVRYQYLLESFVSMEAPSDAKIVEALKLRPKSSVTIYYNSANKHIWTYNPFLGIYQETNNVFDETAVDTHIDSVRLIIGVRSTDGSLLNGAIDISDVKLEYDSLSTVWTQNVGETYSKQYKMDEKGFSISSDTNTMFIDEDEITAYKTGQNGELDKDNPVFQIKEDETILKETTVYEQLNIGTSTNDKANAFVMKQQNIGGKWYFIFY